MHFSTKSIQHSIMKHITLSMAPMFLLIWACSTDGGIPRYLEVPPKNLENVPKQEQQLPESEYEPAYLVKAGSIRFEASEGMNGSITDSWIQVLHFEDYGRKERNEIYNQDGVPVHAGFNIGDKYISLDLDEKIANEWEVGDQSGLSNSFDWYVQRAGGSAYDWGKEIVAGIECDVFYEPIEGGIAKYAGWGNIVFISDFKSSVWGDYYLGAIEFTEGPVDPKLFQVPEGFTIKKW